MTPNNETGVTKIHPASREMLPDDPLDLQAVELPGDPYLMLRLMVEEYARMGWNLESIMQLARDPFYRAFHGLWQLLGEEQFRRQVTTILSRTGVTRVKTVAREPPPQQLVQIDLGDTM